jgi:hypothetical protein
MSYVAVVLNHESSELLKEKFEIPKNWKVYCHHMTINLGNLDQNFLGNLNLNNEVLLKAVTFSQDEKCMAVGILTDVPSKNRIKHITIACSPIGKPKDSNQLINWEPIPELKLTGFIQIVN